MAKIDAELKSLITRELTEATERLITEAEKKRQKAQQLLIEAVQDVERAAKMRECDAAGTHKFKTVPGTGMFGDRFQEKCTKCGWIHEA